MSLRCFTAVLPCLLAALVCGESTSSEHHSLIEELEYGSLPDHISPDTVVVTFFYDQSHAQAAAGHHLLKQLNRYFSRRPAVDIKLCKVSCAGEETGQFCRPDLVNRAVHAFRQGHPRVTLSLAAPSPLDAVIATSLHLWLADRVAVLNTARELADLQASCRGRCSILAAYFPSLGAAEHRLLLEAALEEHTADHTTDDVTTRLQFVMTSSEEAVVDLPPPLYQSFEDQTELLSPRLWMLMCAGEDAEALSTPRGCPASGFHWELRAEELRHFLRASTRPGWVAADGPVAARGLPFDVRRVHVVLLLADSTGLDAVTAIAPSLGTLFRGSVGFVVVNIDVWPAEPLTELGLDREQLYLPSLAFIARGTEKVSAVLNEYDDAIGFVQSQVITYLKSVERQQRAVADWDDLQLQMDTVPAVLRQDDELELTLPDEDDFSAIRDISADEFDSLAHSAEFAVVVGYLPWDPVSRCLLRDLTAFPAEQRRHLARISCLDWSELCDRLGVRSHPHVTVLSSGHRRRSNATRTAQAVARLINNGASPVPLPVDKARLTRWMDGRLTGSPLDGTDSVLLIPASHSQQPPLEFTGRLRGEALVAQMEDTELQDMFGQTSALCVKRKDPFQPTVEIDIAKPDLAIAKCVPVMPSLDEETLDLLSPSQWMFLLFCPDRSSCPATSAEDGLTEAAGQLALTTPNCFWIDSSSSVGRQVLQQYQLSSPAGLVAVNLTSGQVVKYAGATSAEAVFLWAEQVLSGQLRGQVLLKSEPWLPLLPPIDFSSSSRHSSESSSMSEHESAADLMEEFQGAADGPQVQRDEL